MEEVARAPANARAGDERQPTSHPLRQLWPPRKEGPVRLLQQRSLTGGPAGHELGSGGEVQLPQPRHKRPWQGAGEQSPHGSRSCRRHCCSEHLDRDGGHSDFRCLWAQRQEGAGG